jgi:hypothetical protein
MQRLCKRRWFWLAAPVIVAAVALLLFCWTHRVWSLGEWHVYQMMEKECHPVWRDFHFGRIQAGDPVDEVIDRTAPVRVDRNDRWTTLDYHGGGLCFTGLTAVAYDGRLVFAYAWSCTWIRLFFDDLSEEQNLELFSTAKDDPRRLGIAPVYR